MKDSGLAEAMLPRFRSGPEVWRWSAANAQGAEMQAAVDDLGEMRFGEDPAEFLDVVQRAIKASITVILKADDSSGLIGDAIRDLLDLHVVAVAEAQPAPAKLVRWMIAFQFDGRQDFFEIDPVAYAPALGERGIALYRSKLSEIAAAQPTPAPDFSALRYALEHNAKRLAVLDRDIEAIIATHVRDGRVAAWLEDASKAFEEIGRIDLAIEWAENAMRHDLGWQAERASDRWCALLAEHRLDDLPAARLEAFRRWPKAASAAKLVAATEDWPALEPEVLAALRTDPREAVRFALTTDPLAALDLYDELDVQDRQVAIALAEALEAVDVGRALPLHFAVVEADLVQANTRVYRPVAKRLVRLRKIAKNAALEHDVDDFVSELRARYFRRSSMLAEFERARLP